MLFDLVTSLGLADEVDERLADLRVQVFDDVLLLSLREAHQQSVVHLG